MQKALFFKLGFYESQNPLSERVIEDFLILNPVIGSIATQAPTKKRDYQEVLLERFVAR